MRRLDEAVEAIVTLGGDTGATLKNLLNAEGVPVHEIRVHANTRPSPTLFVEDQQVNFRIVGEAGVQTEDEWRQVLDRLNEFESLPPYIVLSGSFPPGVPNSLVGEIADLCRHRRSRLVFDEYGEALRVAVESKVDLIKPSKEELADLVDEDGYDPDFDYRAAAQRIVDSGVPRLVVSLGGAGTYVLSEAGDEARMRPPEGRGRQHRHGPGTPPLRGSWPGSPGGCRSSTRFGWARRAAQAPACTAARSCSRTRTSPGSFRWVARMSTACRWLAGVRLVRLNRVAAGVQHWRRRASGRS